MSTGIRTLDKSLQKTKEWLKEIEQELHLMSEEDAFSILRSVLHALRDRLPVEEAVNLAAQLPILVQGVYYEGWKPAGKPLKMHTEEEFFNHMASELPGRLEVNLERAAKGVFYILQKHISEGEMQDIKSNMPAKLLGLFPETSKIVS